MLYTRSIQVSLIRVITLLFIFLSQYAHADIFGTDDRVDVKKNGHLNHLSQAVAVGVLSSLWDGHAEKDFDSIYYDNISDYMCADEKFFKQTSISYACSGFLVGPDLLMTAGHCATNIAIVHNGTDLYCDSYTWMFDYYEEEDLGRVPKSNKYKCKEIIYAVSNNEDASYLDFALIRLDRKVEGRKPLTLATNDAREHNEVTMLGHPMGLPMKYTDNAYAFQSEKNRNTFLTNLDAFSGNSGSPVFNSNDEVVGMLVAGNPSDSTYEDKVNKCSRFNSCDSNGLNCSVQSFDPNNVGFPYTFSEVQKMSVFKDLINKNLPQIYL